MATTVRQALKGRGDFVSDIYVPDMLYASTIRSPYASAAIHRVDATRPPAGTTCVTAATIPGSNELTVGDESMPILAERRANYAGEPIALIAGQSQRAVLAATSDVYIEFAEQPGSFAFVHPDPQRIQSHRVVEQGRVDDALSSSVRVVDGTYRTGIQEHLYNEPQGAVAIPGDDAMEIRCATQWPYHVRATVAAALGWPAQRVIVRPGDPGISLDGKLWYPSLVAAHAALLAHAADRPVKLVYSNVEDFRYTSKRAPVTVRVSTGLSDSGELIAADIEAFYNAGAYPLFTSEIVEQLTASLFCHYVCENIRISVTAVRTNLPPLNVLSGFAAASAHFATESHAARIVELTESDPVVWRTAAAAGHAKGRRGRDTIARLADVLGEAARQSDFSRKHAAYELQKKRRDASQQRSPTRGIGIAVASQGSGFIGEHRNEYNGTIVVRLDGDRSATLLTSAVAGSTSVAQGWRRIVAETLGIEQQAVHVARPDTDLTPDSGPSTLSRNVAVIGRSIELACEAIQKQRFRKPLPIEVRRSGKVTRTSRFGPTTRGESPYGELSYAVAVVEVAVDPVTFESAVENVWLVVDGGRIVDEVEARRSLEMTTTQALEWATHELVTYHDGVIDPRSYLTYRNIARPVRPRISIEIESANDRAPLGIGELPQSCIPAALAAAVSQATSRYMDQVPTDPQLIHGYLEHA